MLLRGAGNAHDGGEVNILRRADNVLGALVAYGGMLAVDDDEVKPRPAEHLRGDGAVELIERAENRLVVFQLVFD